MIIDMIKIVLIFCAVLFCANTIILESYQTHVSSPVITSDKTVYKQGDKVIISGWVNYNEEPTSDVLLKIVTTNPLKVKIFDEYVTSGPNGAFSTEIPIANNAEIGNYVIEIISQCREIHREICTHQSETISITIGNESKQNKKVPDWVRNIFVWYAEDKVSEEELLGAIEFLINKKSFKLKPKAHNFVFKIFTIFKLLIICSNSNLQTRLPFWGWKGCR